MKTLFCLVILLTTSTYAVTRYVALNGGNAAPYTNWAMAATDLQGAADMSVDGDVVVVSNGIYNTGYRNAGNARNRLVISSNITVTSLNGYKQTIIEGQGPLGDTAVRCVYMYKGNLDGFTIRNGHTKAAGSTEEHNGGGIHAEYSTGTIKNCYLVNNKAAWAGGGISGASSYNCLIVSNQATYGAGANLVALKNCTVANNAGNGVQQCNVENSIVYFNTTAQNISTFKYSCVLPMQAGTGNITNNPLFVNATADDYHLSSASPCIGAGTNLPWMSGTTDLDGNPRVLNGKVDMGAYEYVAAVLVITSTPMAVEYDTVACVIAGTNAGVIGMLWASNDANSLVYTFPAEQAWITPGIALEVGTNPIHVCGTSVFNTVVSDRVIITRLPAGTSPPYVDVTTTPVTVSYDQTACAIAGTNNVNVVGTLAWSNVTTQTGGSLPAALTWSIADIAVAVGANALVVVGTNAYGVRAQDSVVVTRGDIGTGAPFIDITNSIIGTLSYDTTVMVLGGTNNPHVVGSIWWSNVTANIGGMATRAGQAWRATVQLRRSTEGDTVNTIAVYGTNEWQQQAVDGIEISVGGQGTGAPFVDITNATPPALSYDVTSYTVGITNNMQVVGTRRWTNALTSENGVLVNNQATIPLNVGANVIMVTGTNEWNVSASDTITITRGGIGTGAPFVDITNVQAGPVNNSVSSFTVAGTNNPQVVGTMWWINAADDSRGAFAADPSWQADVPLAVGLNTIVVRGTNLWTVQTNDTVVVMRLPGAPANVSATDGTFTNQVRITFAASVGATKYMVYRAPGNAPTNFTGLSSEITATTYDDATVVAGQQYYYAVQAGSLYGWSALSASDSGFALFAINAGEWKYKAGAKVNKKGKMTGKDILKGSQVNPSLMLYFAQGWRIGLAGLVNGSLTNWNGPYSLTPNKSQKLWQVKDPAKGTPKVCLIKYRVNDKKGDKLDYQLWTNMPADKVVYILPTNLLFGTNLLLNEQDNSAPPVQFRLRSTGKVDKQGWQPLDATVIGVQ